MINSVRTHLVLQAPCIVPRGPWSGKRFRQLISIDGTGAGQPNGKWRVLDPVNVRFILGASCTSRQKEARLTSSNRMGGGREEVFRASLTPCEGQLLCRSDSVIYCVGK